MQNLFLISFDPCDTAPDRIRLMAAGCNITPEEIIKRAIGQYLGGYNLNSISENFEADSLAEFFEKAGLLKKSNPYYSKSESLSLSVSLSGADQAINSDDGF